MKIRVGIIGFGDHMTDKLIPALQAIDSVQLVYGCCRTIPVLETKQAELGLLATTTNWQEMLNTQYIDAVIVTGPPALHSAVAKAAIVNGIHVFCEKPLSIDNVTAHELCELATIHPHVITSVGLNFMYLDMLNNPALKKTDADIYCVARAMFTTPLWNTKDVIESFLYAVLIHPISILWKVYGYPRNIKINSCSLNDGHLQGEIFLETMTQDLSLQFNNFADKFKFFVTFSNCTNTVAQLNASGGTDNKKQSYMQELKAFFNAILTSDNNLQSNFVNNATIQDYLCDIYNALINHLELNTVKPTQTPKARVTN